jgi:hypothetical protein
MELCEYGDLEEVLRRCPHPPLRAVAGLFRQMAAAVRCGQAELCLRHYDVKLLNFFLAARPGPGAVSPPPPALAPDFWERAAEAAAAGGGAEAGGLVVKLADYGTADVGPAGMGRPMTERQVCPGPRPAAASRLLVRLTRCHGLPPLSVAAGRASSIAFRPRASLVRRHF